MYSKAMSNLERPNTMVRQMKQETHPSLPLDPDPGHTCPCQFPLSHPLPMHSSEIQNPSQAKKRAKVHHRKPSNASHAIALPAYYAAPRHAMTIYAAQGMLYANSESMESKQGQCMM
ncbi:hypothetical protein BCR34DRAFT_359426 [Clohesyomyces aquaticus]|uniref:Uncharacterized protein n=1 Tax=Clohesyomyces aquaticus TaxID=1231657 RepID=A0A1Y1ZJ10_9PLEO|nr:hypothetical protein BCR34DRAFT_359426 [Clohesyomyces aquaticus]